MARTSLLRYSVFLSAVKTIKTRKLLFIINISIFFAIFALTATCMSIFFENKIEKIETELIREDLNHVVFTNWLQKTPDMIKNNEKIISGLFKDENYQSLVRTLTNRDEELPEDSINYAIITDREQFYVPYYIVRKRVSFNFNSIMQSVTDGILISSSEKDLHELTEYRKIYHSLYTEFNDLENKRYMMRGNFLELSELSPKEKFLFYKNFRELLPEMVLILEKQNNFFLNFNSFFFSKKRNEYLNKTIEHQNKIKTLSKKEANFILIAFLIQIIIFIIIQFFEFTVEFYRKKTLK